MTERFSGSCVQKETSQEAEHRNLINITTAKARLDLNLQDAEVPPKQQKCGFLPAVQTSGDAYIWYRYTENTLQRKWVLWSERVFSFLTDWQ